MYYLSFFGVLLLLGGAFYLCRAVSGYYDSRLGYYKEFLSFLYMLKHKIASSGTRIPEIIDGAEHLSLLEGCGFLKTAREEGVRSAFEKVEDKIPMEILDKNELRVFFAELGSNMLGAEIDNIDRCIITLQRSYEQMRQQTPSSKKVSSTVIICGALLAIVMII